jgi:CubicO group peptidase (beta-lactamase class C family)
MKKLALLFIAILSLQLNLFAQLEFFNNNQEHNIFSEQSVASVNVNPDSLMLDSIITAYKTSESIPGISTMILKDNEVIWNNNYGYRNLQSQLPVEDSTFFLIGSISKTFVATSIMQLWQKGMIEHEKKIKKNINNYLPSGFKVANPYFPDDTITVKMLIVHTSSLQENWDVLTPLITCGNSPIKLDSFLINYLTPGGKYYSVNNFYNYRPGQKWNYTNVGYGLLALMVENLTGNTFDQYCRDSIFIPLSMNSSSWFLDGMDPNQIATPYQEGPICQQGFPNYPEGFLRTNKLEILNYLLAYMNYGIYNNVRILDSTTVAYMLSDQLGYPAVMELPWATYTQGLSWWLAFPINSSAWGRGGGWNGFLAYVSLEQTEKWVTIFFQNQKPLNTIVGKIGEINYPFTKYAHLYGNIYSLRPIVINPYAETNKDSVLFRTTFSNIYNHQFTPHLIYANSDSTEMDSLTLFDDGLHDDLLSNDGTYAGYIPPPQKNEDFYTISVSTIDNQTNKYFNTPNISGYTTAGPVVVDSLYSAFVPAQKRFSFKPYLKNLGNTLQINSPSVKVICNDS